MHITLLCNAGLAVSYEGKMLLVDLPNRPMEPYASLSEGEWKRILSREPPYDGVCGFYFTHDHPDHCHMKLVNEYCEKWRGTPVFMPDKNTGDGTILIGPFAVSYGQIDHAPMNEPTPPHVVSWIRAGAKSIYLAADAKLDVEEHRRFLKGRVANAAFWNAMYLSRAETRLLMQQTAQRNYIYHMPATEPDQFGIWKKCRNNLRRYGEELKTVQILNQYPVAIEI